MKTADNRGEREASGQSRPHDAKKRRCKVDGCTEPRYVSPAGHGKRYCGRHLAQRRRPPDRTARNRDYYHRDALEEAGR